MHVGKLKVIVKTDPTLVLDVHLVFRVRSYLKLISLVVCLCGNGEEKRQII